MFPLAERSYNGLPVYKTLARDGRKDRYIIYHDILKAWHITSGISKSAKREMRSARSGPELFPMLEWQYFSHDKTIRQYRGAREVEEVWLTDDTVTWTRKDN